MNRLYTFAAILIAALSFAASAEVFIIERTDGTVVQFNTENIKEMRFKADDELTGNLAPESVEIVDLGLSVCWASHNVGATAPAYVGDYVMWGGTEQVNRYSWSGYPYGDAQGLSKYNKSDGLTNLQVEDDYASQQWGTDWRMPTRQEVLELIENCDIDLHATELDRPGVRLTSKVPGYEGRYIFIPCNGYIFDEQNLDYNNVYLWTNEVCVGFYQFAFAMMFKTEGDNTGLISAIGQYRYLGQGVRPVYTKEAPEPPVVEVEDDTVDLGLSVRWATFNVGAESEEQPGTYVAWGETEAKDSYTWNDYAFGTAATKVTKYGKSDQITVLEPADDLATVVMGDDYRTPTKDEMEELLQNCTITTDEVNGVNGVRFTSKVEGYEDKSIFFPLTGEKFNDGIKNDVSAINLWTATLAGTSLMMQGKAYGLDISLLNPADAKIASSDRYLGRPVRAVKAK